LKKGEKIMKKTFLGIRKGFTLAEVLITLGIIGVVAAMTIPTLIQNTNSVRFATQFKKTVSTLSQAALMSQAQYDIDYSLASDTITNCGTEVVSNQGQQTICGILNATLAGQTHLGKYGAVAGVSGNAESDKYAIATTAFPTPTGYEIYSLADGSMVGINPNAKSCNLAPGTILDANALKPQKGTAAVGTQGEEGYQPQSADYEAAGALGNCLGFVDVNGTTPPNKEVQCASGPTKLDPSENCPLNVIGSSGMGDVFPIVFHNGTVEPASNAAKMALTRGK
jgi:prepilin-type N-terminal cleavage/methylation domain-containing protein